jgi:hypothetical protein
MGRSGKRIGLISFNTQKLDFCKLMIYNSSVSIFILGSIFWSKLNDNPLEQTK